MTERVVSTVTQVPWGELNKKRNLMFTRKDKLVQPSDLLNDNASLVHLFLAVTMGCQEEE